MVRPWWEVLRSGVSHRVLEQLGAGAARSRTSCPFESGEGLASQEARKGRLRAADVAEDLGGPVLSQAGRQQGEV